MQLNLGCQFKGAIAKTTHELADSLAYYGPLQLVSPRPKPPHFAQKKVQLWQFEGGNGHCKHQNTDTAGDRQL